MQAAHYVSVQAAHVVHWAFSHLTWDAFTHHDGLGVQFMPLLIAEVSFFGDTPLYFLLQVFFSILGMILIHFYIMHMPQNLSNLQDSSSDIRYWILFFCLILLISAFRLIAWPEFNSFGGVLIGIMGSIFYSIISVSIIFKSSKRDNEYIN